ncbi:MAG: orotidine 5'-phosphate decarboxylase [Candidatus Nomurabacteria bacterium]|jgi:orotidine-5'-phosphate decarboxylase|nr:orotidine 5'-phosphate decarboxylase [Candidatus Nomurabacteria bacterium]
MKLYPNKIIWSADLPLDDLCRVLKSGVLPAGIIIKLDRLFFEQFGIHTINVVESLGYQVFADAKIVEIPEKVAQIARHYGQYQPFMLDCMAGICSNGVFAGSDHKQLDGLKRFASTCLENSVNPCGVTVLTSKTNAKNRGMVFQEFRRSADKQVLFYVSLLSRAGFTDVVCAPKEATVIRKHREFDHLNLNTPGVRLPETDVRDQARVMTPSKAFGSGADRLIIGSNLTDGAEQDIVERVHRNWQRLVAHFGEV